MKDRLDRWLDGKGDNALPVRCRTIGCLLIFIGLVILPFWGAIPLQDPIVPDERREQGTRFFFFGGCVGTILLCIVGSWLIAWAKSHWNVTQEGRAE